MSDRGTKAKTPLELRAALQVERRGLYEHLANDSKTLAYVSQVLGLSETKVEAVKSAMESGDEQDQIALYDKVVSELQKAGLYDRKFNYFWMGFRYVADKYWLSNTAMKLAKAAIT